MQNINNQIAKHRKEMFDLRFANPEKKPKDFASQMRKARKEIARLSLQKRKAIK